MIHLERVAREIKTIGLYDLVYQDVEKALGKKHIELIDIEHCLQTHPEILEAYKQTNLEYNISNIHIKPIDEASVDTECKEDVRRVNANLATLQEIEKYTIDFEQSSILVYHVDRIFCPLFGAVFYCLA